MPFIDNRRRVLLYLRRNGEASVGELSQGLELTQVTVRKHLEVLMREEYVAPPEKRRRGGPGRPVQAYALTEKADSLMPENYHDLALAVVGVLSDRHGAEWVRKLLLAAGAQAGEGFGVTAGRDEEAFLPQVLSELDRRGYLSAAGTWSGRRCLTFAHCPYLDAARASPVVCAFDQALMEKVLGEPVVLFRRIAEHDEQCVFLLGA
jgi:predicted ArsR family transcriptional regulator